MTRIYLGINGLRSPPKNLNMAESCKRVVGWLTGYASSLRGQLRFLNIPRPISSRSRPLPLYVGQALLVHCACETSNEAEIPQSGRTARARPSLSACLDRNT